MKENSGQISGEFIFLTGVLIVILMLSAVFITSENELNIAMSAARSGAVEGVGMSSIGMYARDTYNEYSDSGNGLLYPYSVDIVNVSYNEMGLVKVYAKSSKQYSKSELDSIGDRINYNIRKSVAISFNSTTSTNKLYNPVFSPHYVFTTANVKWL